MEISYVDVHIAVAQLYRNVSTKMCTCYILSKGLLHNTKIMNKIRHYRIKGLASTGSTTILFSFSFDLNFSVSCTVCELLIEPDRMTQIHDAGFHIRLR